MARTLKSWEKEVKQKYLEFSQAPDCKRCPLWFDFSREGYKYRPYQKMIEKLYNTDVCACCHHILNTPLGKPGSGYCPCHILNEGKAIEILINWAKSQGE